MTPTNSLVPNEAAPEPPAEPRPSNFIRDAMIEDLKTKKYGDAVIQTRFPPVDRDDPDLPHPQLGAQQQDLRERTGRRSARTAAGTAPPSRGPAPAPRRSP